LRALVLVAALAAALVAALVAASACRSSSAASLPEIDDLRCDGTVAPSEPASLGAFEEIAAKESAPLSGRVDHGGHGEAGPEPPIATEGEARDALAGELRAAAQAACRLRSPEDASRAGYLLSSSYTQGVGTHWINWRLVDAPFDAARPSMLLFAPRRGETTLVGLSYWTRTADGDAPEGFSGTADHWHAHDGLCFDARGALDRENVATSAECDGAWLNGSDIWMLHAWVVPGQPNPWGLFAPMNPVLCDRNVPDVSRCPEPD
jgi:hypothetical protein